MTIVISSGTTWGLVSLVLGEDLQRVWKALAQGMWTRAWLFGESKGDYSLGKILGPPDACFFANLIRVKVNNKTGCDLVSEEMKSKR